MAKIFLSYSRNDFERIEPLAKALEKEGHFVWWDRRVQAGSEFDAVIERALADAEWVVVAWSKNASRSAWVRDEAAVGRDRHCLVPLTLDGSPPPLGFRQFQTIDLSRWTGRGHPPQLDELIEVMAAHISDAKTHGPSVEPPRQRRLFAVPRLSIAAAVAALLVAVIAGGWWWAARGPAHTPTVAIEAGNGSEKSREVARELANQLSDSSGGAFQLVSDKSDADLILQVDAKDNSKTLRRDLSVLSGRSILWSATVEMEPISADDLAQVLQRISKRMLSCTLEARRDRIDPPTLKLYLRGCSQLLNGWGGARLKYDMPAVQLFEQVVRNAPHFEGGWAKLLLATQTAGDLNELKREIAQVEKLGFRPGELYAAKSALLPPQDFLGKLALLKRGIELDPDNAHLYSLRANQSARVGRMKDAISDAGRALQLDPISLNSQVTYILLLGIGGEIEQAEEQLNSLKAKWLSASNNNGVAYVFNKNLGDPKEALIIYRDGVAPSVVPNQKDEDFILARIEPTPANIQHAINNARDDYARHPSHAAELLQVLGQFGRTDEAIDFMLHYTGPDTIISGDMFGPAMRDVWRDPRSMAAAAHLGLLRFWRASGHWPDFCFQPDRRYDCKKEAAKFDGNAFLQLRPAPPDLSRQVSYETAECHDGNISFSKSRRDACSLHGGVAKWLSTGKPS